MSIHDPSEVPHVLTDASPSQGAAAPSEEEPEKDNPPCWCGAENPHYDEDFLSPTCGGSGTLYCYCGGDLCVCHFHGETDCPGCEDCGDGEPDDDGEFDDAPEGAF